MTRLIRDKTTSGRAQNGESADADFLAGAFAGALAMQVTLRVACAGFGTSGHISMLLSYRRFRTLTALTPAKDTVRVASIFEE